ncbi:zinc ribbon domain-containing protein [Vibrio diabolicus]|uniref:zinc ribbon domain-containing protein n=1 Tax=Vibrio diabolicus TaxID=50719 RepID=UPI002160D9E3|nr:zinc ribbon domain-containing protein [Vibrio diabolicus]MCS0445656.1 zinc ribbon domain-containing protein [Vibrio diabolicus]
MQQNFCPICNVELEWTGQYHCAQCESDFKKVGFCPDCEAELEKLQACGAASHFCNVCNELKSKSRVRFEFQKIS